MEEGNLALSVFSSGVASVYIIELLKKSPLFPFITKHTVVLNRYIGILASGAATLGISFSFDSQAGSLLITGLTFTTAAHSAWHWFTQWAVQQFVYTTAVEGKK